MGFRTFGGDECCFFYVFLLPATLLEWSISPVIAAETLNWSETLHNPQYERFREYWLEPVTVSSIILAYFTIGFFLIEALRWVFSQFKRD
jgi:hypothetical protein